MAWKVTFEICIPYSACALRAKAFMDQGSLGLCMMGMCEWWGATNYRGHVYHHTH